jgi:hypothetical protein
MNFLTTTTGTFYGFCKRKKHAFSPPLPANHPWLTVCPPLPPDIALRTPVITIRYREQAGDWEKEDALEPWSQTKSGIAAKRSFEIKPFDIKSR